MKKDLAKIYTIFFNSLSHKMRTPLSIIQNNLTYMNKTKDVSECNISLKKVGELTKFISDLNVEVEDNISPVKLSELETLDFFKNNPSFFDSTFKETNIFLDIYAFDKLINYFSLVARTNFNCQNVVVEGLDENDNSVLNIVYDNPKSEKAFLSKPYSYLSFLVKDALAIDVLEAALYDLNASYFNFYSQFSLNSESLALRIKFIKGSGNE